MTRCWQRCGFQLALASSVLLGGAIAYFEDCALAQITPDGTLPNNSIVTPQGNTSVIEGGTQAGSNLFHSFDQFSIPTGGAAYFNNALDIQNIFSRVTGGSISNIDGLIQANASANLFLLNPNGIIFGPNASLNIGGSFLASTASNINFADGTQFSAKAPETTPLLTVSVPIGLQIGANAGDIRVQGSALAVPPGKNLTLVGSEVEFEEGSLTPARGLIEIDTGSTEVSLSQIAPDATLPVNSIVTPQGNASIITGGTVAGSNLFHSFEKFSVPTGSTAYFNNALDIQNIIARVTGSSASNIDGSIAANGIANLFLLNPNGIIFGPNAKLDIGGSILVSTATRLKFADGTFFSATAHPTTPLLGVSVPISLQFGETAGDIRVQQARLAVQPGKTLALVGGDVTLEGFPPSGGSVQTYSSLSVLEGRIELGSVAGVGEVSLSQRDNSSVLGYDLVDAFGDISLKGRVSVNVSGERGGSIQIQSAKLEMTQGARISTDTTGIGPGGEVLIKTTEAITLSDDSEISSYVRGSGTAGSLRIETGKLIVRDGARVSAAINGSGQEGTLTVTASDSVELSGTGSGLFTAVRGFVSTSTYIEPIEQPTTSNTSVDVSAEDTGRGVVGDLAITTEQGGTLTVTALGSAELFAITPDSRISAEIDGSRSDRAVGGLTIETGKLVVRDGAAVSTANYGEGQGGTLAVTAKDSVELIGTSANGQAASGLFTQTEGTGDAGDLRIETGKLIVRDRAVVSTATYGEGQGGTLAVTAKDSVELIGSLLLASTFGTGAAGDLTITTGKLIVQNDAVVSTGTFGEGQGGNLAVTAKDSVELIRSFLLTSTFDIGAAGHLTITTDKLSGRDGAAVFTGTLGEGQGGNLAVTAKDSVELIGSLLFASTFGTGAAGDLTITTGKLSVRDEAQVQVSSEGTGNAGNLRVQAGSIRLDNQALLSADTKAGQGNIELRSRDLVLRRGSNITTNATGTATGGNITIDTGIIAALENSDISANASEAFGGRILIDSQGIFGTEFRNQKTPLSDITATSRLGPKFSGTVEINILDIDPSQGLATLPAELVEASGLIASSCAAVGENKFIITGRGGLPPSPSEPLSSDALWIDWVTLNPGEENRSSPTVSTNPTAPEPAPIVEARGWVINGKGEVMLTATAPTTTPHSPWIPSATCHTPQASS